MGVLCEKCAGDVELELRKSFEAMVERCRQDLNVANAFNKQLHDAHAAAKVFKKERDEARAAAVDLAKKVATLRTAMFEIRQHTAPSGIDRGDSAVEAIATAALEETKGVSR